MNVGPTSQETPFPVHLYKKGSRKCVTDSIGQTTPKGKSETALVLDAVPGFIPLWDVNVTLYYRFQERSLQKYTSDATATKQVIRDRLTEALQRWGSAVPVRFMENNAIWDFEIAMRADEDGILASSFFPDGGQHELVIYPAMFDQPDDEQIDTLIHELGHVFGLRHFFAPAREKAFPYELWGQQSEFSIMNYEDLTTPTQEESILTRRDKYDLTKLYDLVWSRKLRQINGTPIVLFKPFHSNMP
ncbi:peptidase M10A and M12B matrixin and adamalysin [Linnemannia elongata]|nr:peptidase M10A and M12B matrixin and adamalysin [Linnemannia elongata]